MALFTSGELGSKVDGVGIESQFFSVQILADCTTIELWWSVKILILSKSSLGKKISVIAVAPPSAKSSQEDISKIKRSSIFLSTINRVATCILEANLSEKLLIPAFLRSLAIESHFAHE